MPPSGSRYVIENYPKIVRAGIQLALDPPADVEIRVDPDGERKAETPHLPAIKTIHLQWFDTSYTPTWRDTAIHIDLEKRRFHQIEGWLIGHQRHGSGAIGVALFSAPALALLSPYLIARGGIYRAQERKHGMSRHGIALLRKLKGQLDAPTEAVLVETLKNVWIRDRKLGRRVSFEEARDLLVECELTVHRYGSPGGKPHGQAYYWHDPDHDLIAQAEIEVGSPNPPEVRVLRSRFEGAQALAVMQCYLHKTEQEYETDSPD